MVVLPYDIIFEIYFKIDDYQTICNFFILNKTFLNEYLYHYSKKTFKHKFSIIFDYIFSFLHILQFSKVSERDMEFLISLESNNRLESRIFRNELFLIYKLYKNMVFSEVRKWFGHRYALNNGLKICNTILSQGSKHLDRCIKVNFDRNKISLEIKYSQDNPSYLLWPSYNESVRLITNNFEIFENYFIEN
jgi:hypothetical protein